MGGGNEREVGGATQKGSKRWKERESTKPKKLKNEIMIHDNMCQQMAEVEECDSTT